MSGVQEGVLAPTIAPVSEVVVVDVDLGEGCQSFGNLVRLCVEFRDGPAGNEGECDSWRYTTDFSFTQI